MLGLLYDKKLGADRAAFMVYYCGGKINDLPLLHRINMSKPGDFIPEHISSIDYDLLCDYAEEQYAKIKAKSMPAMRKSAQTTPPSVATRSTSGRAHSFTTQTSPLGAPADQSEATLQDSIRGYFNPVVEAEFNSKAVGEYNLLKDKDPKTEYR